MLLALAYALGPISGAHVNPAVTMGFLVSRRLLLEDAIGYWVAQFVGGIAGALVLWGSSPVRRSTAGTGTGLGADGFGKNSMIGINTAGAFAAEAILTFLFVFIVLAATSNGWRRRGSPGWPSASALSVVHLIGIPITGTSVNPARSLGPGVDRRWLVPQPGLALHRGSPGRRRRRRHVRRILLRRDGRGATAVPDAGRRPLHDSALR